VKDADAGINESEWTKANLIQLEKALSKKVG
jgi:hypothetical protein